MSAAVVIVMVLGVWALVIGLVLSLVHMAGRPEPSLGPAGPFARDLRSRATLADTASDEGTLERMLRALADEDPSAARHAAAVARNALALARDAGMPTREQEIAHTAGLLHDIGKKPALSGIPVAERALRRNDHRMIRRHPVDGARLVRQVPGLESVADVVLSHHERLDGNGYPYGLRGQAIPPAARVVAVAEVYDVLTAPDSYRRPLSSERAIAELRGAAGTQLDAHLVEIFATSIAGRLNSSPPDEADLETELRRQPLGWAITRPRTR